MDYTEKNSLKPKILLHICCAGCGVYIGQLLGVDFDVTLFFYNPNIFPEAEYGVRLKEVERVAGQYSLPLLADNYDHDKWRSAVRGHEQDPERGERCLICYRARLEETAKVSQRKNFDYFTTTLTVSPHKSAKEIMAIGNELARKYNIKFLDRDFKKQDGFKKSAKLARALDLYRQDYCGCEYSV